MNKSDKMKAISYFLTEIMDKEFPLEVRKEEMLKFGSTFCRGFPEWSDVWGYELSAIDDINKNELKELLCEIN